MSGVGWATKQLLGRAQPILLEAGKRALKRYAIQSLKV